MTEITLGRKISLLSATFRKPSYVALTVVLTAFFSYALYILSLRSAGVHTTMITTTESSVGFWLKTFGPGYVIGTLSLDIINGLLISTMIVLAVSSVLWRAPAERARQHPCCSESQRLGRKDRRIFLHLDIANYLLAEPH